MTMKIYIVEDSEIISQRIKRLLSAIEGIEIAGVSEDFEEALISIKNLQPEVIILDISVGKSKGLNTIQDIKNVHPQTKIIMFTNFNFNNYKEISFEYGADYYLDKSNEFQNLPDVIEELKKKHNSIELTAVIKSKSLLFC